MVYWNFSEKGCREARFKGSRDFCVILVEF